MRLIIPLFIITFLSGCAVKLPYLSTYPLSEQYFHSRDGTFYGNVPVGWFSASDDTLGPAVVVWLLKEDFTCTITVNELKLDHFSRNLIAKDGLDILAKLSAAAYGKDIPDSDFEPMLFRLRAKDFCSYELPKNDETRRIVLFEAKGRYYECTAYKLKGEWSEEDFKNLFTVQQSVLGSIGY
ncbi:MAG: hypothetical protein HZB59_08680 [Ignavibacteriales bacterium]|nr:hypothetical protein [Ignavibacteriales bacterium]